jgi:hypothetical protein
MENLRELRRIINTRIKVFGLDKSDIDYTIKFWAMNYGFMSIFAGILLPSSWGGPVVLISMVMFIPIAILVKIIKHGKNKGHLEYIGYSLTNIKEGRQKKVPFFIYNLKKNGFLYKTLFYINKKK